MVNKTKKEHIDPMCGNASTPSSEGAGEMFGEFRSTFVHGLKVSKEGKVILNGRERKVQYRDTRGKSPKGGRSAYVHFQIDGKYYNISIGKLVASAWIDGYDMEKDRILYRDDNPFNHHADNLLIVSPKDYDKQGWQKANKKKDANRERAKAELEAMGFVWRKCYIDGLECTYDGIFRYNGYPINSYTRTQKRSNGREVPHRFLMLKVRGKSKRVTASMAVASAWKMGYNPDKDYVIYKDGDCTNINADNLMVVGEKSYSQYMTRNSHNARLTQAERYDKKLESARSVAHDAAMMVRYLETGDLTEINKHIEREVIPQLKHYIEIVKRKPQLARYLLTTVIEILYIKLDCGTPICNFKKFCERTVDVWIKKKRFENWMFETPEQPYSDYYRMQNQAIEVLGQKFNVVRKNKKVR